MSMSWIAAATRRSSASVDRPVLAGQGEHGAVVAGVAGPVEQEHAGHARDGIRQPIDDVEPPAFGDVRDRFDQHATMLVVRHGRVARWTVAAGAAGGAARLPR